MYFLHYPHFQYSNSPHAHLALFHIFKMPKCQKCQGVMCNGNERKNLTVQECKKCTEYTTNKSRWAMREDGRQGYVSGFPFLRKLIASTATTAVNALCFSHRPTLTITNVNSCLHATGKSDHTHCNHYTGYNGKPLYPVQQYHPCRSCTEIMPFGNSLAH